MNKPTNKLTHKVYLIIPTSYWNNHQLNNLKCHIFLIKTDDDDDDGNHVGVEFTITPSSAELKVQLWRHLSLIFLFCAVKQFHTNLKQKLFLFKCRCLKRMIISQFCLFSINIPMSHQEYDHLLIWEWHH